ncbi:MAG: hypothetical protein DDT20_01039 [Firmicutes bacterium]|nr:hypothetical protein [Bacillota bacterium]
MDLNKLHTQVLYPQVRVKTSKSGGSGTIIYSQSADDGSFHTYALTCHHVIDDAISVKNEWDSKVGRERKREVRQLVVVEFFDWSNVLHGNRPLNYSCDAEIVAYDKDHDMALLKLRTVKRAEFVAQLMPPGEEKAVQIGSPVVACGCALLHDPVLTTGIITHFGDEIDGKLYWMSNAQIIFGNSGGAMFTDGQAGDYEYIGIPSRIAIAGWSSPITHLGYFSPATRVHEFFNEQTFQFLSPRSDMTEKSCEEERKKIKEREERKLIIEAPTAE